MRESGVRTVVDAASLAVVGLVEVVAHIPRIYGEYRTLLTAARRDPPDLAILPSLVAEDPQCARRCLPGYLGMIKRLDEALGRIMDAMKSLGLSENTVLLYTSDHGCHFKTRNREYKRSCHESSIRVPFAICGPPARLEGTVASFRMPRLAVIPKALACPHDLTQTGTAKSQPRTGRNDVEIHHPEERTR